MEIKTVQFLSKIHNRGRRQCFTRTWMNLGCQVRLQSTPPWLIMPRARTETRHMTWRLGIKFPTPGKVKAVKCPGYARGGGDVEASI